MGHKYIINPSNSKFTISLFLTLSAYIFLESIFLKYHCTFSLYKITDLRIGDTPHPLKRTFAYTSSQSP
jgi:hypothetical protein